jgi:hypothetical protein
MKNRRFAPPWIARIQPRPQTDHLKIAVLLIGEVRTMEYCFPRLQDAFKGQHSVTYSLTTWNVRGSSFRKGNQRRSFTKDIGETNAQERLATSDLAIQFPELSHLTLLDKDKIDQEHTAISELAVAGLKSTPWILRHRQEAFMDIFTTLNQLYLSKLAYETTQAEERRSGTPFDIVVRARPDIVLSKKMAWPSQNQIVVDCLSRSRRQKLNLFDGFFAGRLDLIEPLLNGYDGYRRLLENKEFYKAYSQALWIEQFGVKVKYYREISSEDTDGFLRNETFFRQQIAAIKDLEIIDKKLKVRLVR